MPKPSEFFVGVLDFFAILLPGAIATAILTPRIGKFVLGPLITAPTSDAETWAIFLVFAFFLGHLIFLIGSYIDRLYNVLRERLSPYGNERAYQCATHLRDMFIDPSERKALNTFQWSRGVLMAKCPAAAEDVHRLEADSKFFRSVFVVCLLGAIAFFTIGEFVEGVISLLLTLPCFARYYERRLKSTTQAYLHVITVYRLGLLGAKDQAGAG